MKDYTHFTGKYRVTEHSICRRRYGVHYNIPSVLHSGSNYEFDLIIKHLAKMFDSSDFECLTLSLIAKNISFSLPMNKAITKVNNSRRKQKRSSNISCDS